MEIKLTVRRSQVYIRYVVNPHQINLKTSWYYVIIKFYYLQTAVIVFTISPTFKQQI